MAIAKTAAMADRLSIFIVIHLFTGIQEGVGMCPAILTVLLA